GGGGFGEGGGGGEEKTERIRGTVSAGGGPERGERPSDRVADRLLSRRVDRSRRRPGRERAPQRCLEIAIDERHVDLGELARKETCPADKPAESVRVRESQRARRAVRRRREEASDRAHVRERLALLRIRPRRDDDRSAGPHDARGFRERARRAGGVLERIETRDGVEGGVLERQRLHVADEEI